MKLRRLRRVRHFVRHHGPVHGYHAVKWAHQRLTRGWDDRAWWNLNDHLCQTLGSQLLMFSERASSYSPSYTYEAWCDALRENGEKLLAWTSDDRFCLAEKEWDKLYANTQAALRWVADNLADLWD